MTEPAPQVKKQIRCDLEGCAVCLRSHLENGISRLRIYTGPPFEIREDVLWSVKGRVLPAIRESM